MLKLKFISEEDFGTYSGLHLSFINNLTLYVDDDFHSWIYVSILNNNNDEYFRHPDMPICLFCIVFERIINQFSLI